MGLKIITIKEANKFERKPGKFYFNFNNSTIIEDPELWWCLNDLYKGVSVDLEHDNIIKNSVAIETWVDENISHQVVCFSHVVTETTNKEVTVVKKKWFSEDEQKTEIETEKNKFIMWSFYFKEESDAVLFSTTWKGVETK